MVVLGGGQFLMSEVPLYVPCSFDSGGLKPFEKKFISEKGRNCLDPCYLILFFFITLKPRVE